MPHSTTHSETLESNPNNKMRILFVQKGISLFASSGEYRANISLLRHLAHLGHDTAQICFCKDGEVDLCVQETGEDKANLVKSKLLLPATDGGAPKEVHVSIFRNVDGIQIIALDSKVFREVFPRRVFAEMTKEYVENDTMSAQMSAFTGFINSQIDRFQPTHLIFNDSLTLKATANMTRGANNARRIFVIHCAEQLPCGPYAGGLPDSAVSPKETDLLREVDGIWAVSKAVKDYAWKHGRLESTFLIHDKWTYLSEKTHDLPRRYHNWEAPVVGMINPSEVKGVTIFIELAKRMPHIKFATWLSWASNEEIRKRLEQVPNIEIRDTVRNMEDAWKEMKLLLVPSLWLEAWGMVVTEAQLRGIPVISSNAGALSEAKLGVPYIVPVNPLTGEHDDNGNYIVPEQDVEPWIKTLEKLTQKEEYESIAEEARTKTEKWVSNLDPRAIEKWLSGITPRNKRVTERVDEKLSEKLSDKLSERVDEKLSDVFLRV